MRMKIIKQLGLCGVLMIISGCIGDVPGGYALKVNLCITDLKTGEKLSQASVEMFLLIPNELPSDSVVAWEDGRTQLCNNHDLGTDECEELLSGLSDDRGATDENGFIGLNTLLPIDYSAPVSHLYRVQKDGVTEAFSVVMEQGGVISGESFTIQVVSVESVF